MSNRFHSLRLLSFYSKDARYSHSDVNAICLVRIPIQEWSLRLPDFFSYSYSFLACCSVDTVTTKSMKFRFSFNRALRAYFHVIISKKFFLFRLSNTSIHYYTLDKLVCFKEYL